MYRKAFIKIEGGGKDQFVTFSHLSITEQLYGHGSFELSIPAASLEGGKPGRFLDKTQEMVGKIIDLDLADNAKDEIPDVKHRAIVTDVSLQRQHDGEHRIVIRGCNPTVLLDDGANCTSFTEKNYADIANQILQSYPFAKKVSPIFKEKLPYTVQYRETDYAFLCRLAQRFGEWIYYDGEQFCIGKQSAGKEITLHLGRSLSNFTFEMRAIPLKFESRSRNYTQDQSFTANASGNVSGLSAEGEKALKKSDTLFSRQPIGASHYPIYKKADIERDVKMLRESQAASLAVMKGQSDDVNIRIGSKVKVSGYLDFSHKDPITGGTSTEIQYGTYIITQVQHFIDRMGNYRNQFEGIPAELAVPPLNPYVRLPFCETQYAIVKKNEDDEKMGRIKVQFPWQPEKETTPWIRCMNMGSGKERGIFWVPEVGDEVIVGFEYDHPDRPFVLGTLFHGKTKPEDALSTKGNNSKSLRTKSGNEIKLQDDDGKATITIQNPKGQNYIVLTQERDGEITILSEKTINIKTTDVVVEADTMVVDADTSITMKTKVFVLDAKASITMKTDKFEVKAEDSIQATSSKTHLKSSSKTEINGGSMVSISASVIKLN